MLTKKYAFRAAALGAFFLVVWLFPLRSSSACQPPGVAETVKLAWVYDGDTLRLQDGRKVRLLGLNTPEFDRSGQRHQLLAQQAKASAQAFLSNTASLQLYFDRETQDRHGRYLAHVYKTTPAGAASLEQHLLEQGLAWHVAIPPNLHMAECFAEAEQQAMVNKRGLWRDGARSWVKAVRVNTSGYQRVRGQVQNINLSQSWWITLEGGFTAVIRPQAQKYFDRDQVLRWRNKQLEVEGWVTKSSYQNKLQWRVNLQTPYAVSTL